MLSRFFLPLGGMTRFTATVVPRYSALTTMPKVPRPSTCTHVRHQQNISRAQSLVFFAPRRPRGCLLPRYNYIMAARSSKKTGRRMSP